MTSVAAWERRVGERSEMVVASDSRLGGGEEWDACAKIFDIGRDDAVLAFAGHTWRALPLVFQAVATTRSYSGSSLRTLDLPQFAKHLESVLNVVLNEAKGPASKEPPHCEFLLAGWSWKKNAFCAYRYAFDRTAWRFVGIASPQQLPQALRASGRGTIFTQIGDGGWRLQGLLARDYNRGAISGPLGYHPLEYLYRQTKDASLEEASVGGPIQMAKVYRSIRVEHFAVRTDDGLSISGRPVLPYEHLDVRAIERRDDGYWFTESMTAQIPALGESLESLDEDDGKLPAPELDADAGSSASVSRESTSVATSGSSFGSAPDDVKGELL
jgi:hypothetical protein